MNPIKIGLFGLGIVGGGTLKVLQRNQEEIRRRAGRGTEVAIIAVRSLDKARTIVQEAGVIVSVVNDPLAIVDSPEINIVVELIDGYGLTRELVLRTIANGKHVAAVSKALLAVHGNEIFKATQDKGAVVAFEAAVADGIPIIKALREGLTVSRIEWIVGIINSTTNFILSEMCDKDLDLDTVLKEAQRLGHAETDPTFDVGGFDAAYKLTLMSAIVLGVPVQFEYAYVEGTTKLEAVSTRYAEELGYRIRLLGITRRVEVGIELRAHPTLVPVKRLIANMEGAMNAVVVNGDAVGLTLYYGKGAGAESTASAVVADLVDVTRLHMADPEHRVPHLAFQSDALSDTPVLPIDEVCSSYYPRMRVADETGVLADITCTLTRGGISIDATLQKESREGEPQIDIIMLSYVTVEKRVNAAIAAIEALLTALSKVTCIRMEELS